MLTMIQKDQLVVLGVQENNMADYINNPTFLKALIDYKKLCADYLNAEKEKPIVPDYIAECFMKIATNLSYRANFINYTFKDDLISDGIENCLLYAHKFDETKSSNPFAYFTQIIYYAFVRRIVKEKKQTRIRYKMMEVYFEDDNDIKTMLPDDKYQTYLKMVAPDKKVEKEKLKNNLLKFMK